MIIQVGPVKASKERVIIKKRGWQEGSESEKEDIMREAEFELMQGRATSQGMQVASISWKNQGPELQKTLNSQRNPEKEEQS